MAPPKNRRRTSRGRKSCETSKDVPPAPSAYLAIFEKAIDNVTKFCKLTKTRVIFDGEDPEGPFKNALQLMLSADALCEVRITFTKDATGNYTLRMPRGGHLLIVYVNLRLVVCLDALGVRLKNGDLVQFYRKAIQSNASILRSEVILGPAEFQFFVGKEQQPKRKITKKKPSWEMMPSDILEKIFNHVPMHDLLRSVAVTCEKFRSIVFSGRLQSPVLEVNSWMTLYESMSINKIRGSYEQVDTLVVDDSRKATCHALCSLLGDLEGLKTLDIRSPDHCGCYALRIFKFTDLHPNARLKVLKVCLRNCNPSCDPLTPFARLHRLITLLVDHCWISGPNESNPPLFVQQVANAMRLSGDRPVTLVYASNDGRSKWTTRALFARQMKIHELKFEGVYFPGLHVSYTHLVRLNLTIPGKHLRAFFQTFKYPLSLKDLALRIEDDGRFNVDDLEPPRPARDLRTLDLVLPRITEEFCQELCSFNCSVERIHIQVTSVDIPESAMELLRNKPGLRDLTVLGPNSPIPGKIVEYETDWP